MDLGRTHSWEEGRTYGGGADLPTRGRRGGPMVPTRGRRGGPMDLGADLGADLWCPLVGGGADLWRLVSPSERFCALTQAPRAMSSRAHSQLPALAAKRSGVLPLSVRASASARASSSAPTTAACPFTCTNAPSPYLLLCIQA